MKTLVREGRYLRAAFVDGTSGEKSIGEFYFVSNDSTNQWRVGSVDSARGEMLSLRNYDRCEAIRKQGRYFKMPVLRNRRRSLILGEPQFDTFGPGPASLGPRAEKSSGEIDRLQHAIFCDQNGLNCFPFGIRTGK